MRPLLGRTLLIILLTLSIQAQSWASLTFSDGGAHRVNCGSASDLDDLTVVTIAAWIFPTATTQNRRISNKGGNTGFFNFSISSTGTAALSTFIDYTTTDASAVSGDSVLSTNAWQFVAVTYDGANAPKIYHGTLTTALAEVSYASQTAPSGSRVTDNTNDFVIANASQASFNRGFPGRIAWLGLWNRALSLGELREQQFHPHVTSGNLIFMHLGFNGTGTQADWSGLGHNGTVTLATQSDHVPLGRLQ